MSSLAEIGQALRDARKARGLTLQQVATDLGMGVATLSRLERADLDEIGTRRLMRVLDYLGLQLVVRPAGFGMSLEEAMRESEEAFSSGAPPRKP